MPYKGLGHIIVTLEGSEQKSSMSQIFLASDILKFLLNYYITCFLMFSIGSPSQRK